MEFKNSKKGFVIIIMLVIITIIYSYYNGMEQNKVYISEIKRYTAAKVFDNKDLYYLISEINYFQNKDKDNYMFFLDKASIYRNYNQFDNAQIELAKAMNKKLLLEENINFLYLYGETLYLSNDFENAKKYLIKAKKIDESSEYIESINEMLNKIEQEI